MREEMICPECDGRGEWQDKYDDGTYARSATVCSTCDGKGELKKEEYVQSKKTMIRVCLQAAKQHITDLEEVTGSVCMDEMRDITDEIRKVIDPPERMESDYKW